MSGGHKQMERYTWTGEWYRFDIGPHLVDQAVCLFGLPESVTARCLPLRKNSEATDYFHVLLHYRELEVVLHGGSFCRPQ